MDDFLDVIKRDQQIQIKIGDILDIYNELPLKYQSNIGYDTLIQIDILKELLNLMGSTIVDVDIKLKMKNIRTKYLKNK